MRPYFCAALPFLLVTASSLLILTAPALTRAAASASVPPFISIQYPENFLEPTDQDVTFSATVGGGVFIDPPSSSQYSCVLSRSDTLITCTVSENIYSADDAIDIEARSPSGVLAFTGPILVTTISKSLPVRRMPSASGASSVLFLPGTEASRLYVRNEIGAELQVWEPDLYTDIPYLEMNPDGTSKYDLYTKDIIDSTYGNTPAEHAAALQALGADALGVYDGFESFMDGLVTSKTIKEWRAYPYDWRYDVRDIITNGTLTKQRDGSVARIYLEDILKEMASSSPTKKVTIVAHSNGGLLAKALTVALGADAARYIDRIILVGSPQWGTPAAIGALLHADNFAGTPSLILDPLQAREVADTMPDSYDLLPSSTYFSHSASPVVTFAANGPLSSSFAEWFGSALNSLPALTAFLTDTGGLDTYIGSADDIHAPVPVSSALLSKAAATHAALDAWTPPTEIKVTALIGSGQNTVSGLSYRDASKTICTDVSLFTQSCEEVPTLRHEAITTEDGDGTVIASSAKGAISDTLYFDAARFRTDRKENFLHARLTSAKPIQIAIQSILHDTQTSDPYISTTEPSSSHQSLTVISAHSPVTIVATDAAGRETGVVPIAGTDFFGTKEEIPGSSVQVLGDEKYIYVPTGTSYQIRAQGYASGGATLEIGSVQPDGTIENAKSFENITVIPGTVATLSVPEDINVDSSLAVDEDGDGTIDQTIAPITSAFIETPTFIEIDPAIIAPSNAINGAPVKRSPFENERLPIPLVKKPNVIASTSTPHSVQEKSSSFFTKFFSLLHRIWKMILGFLKIHAIQT